MTTAGKANHRSGLTLWLLIFAVLAMFAMVMGAGFNGAGFAGIVVAVAVAVWLVKASKSGGAR